MSSSPVSVLASQTVQSFTAPRFEHARGKGEHDEGDGGQNTSVSLFSALLQALVSAVQQGSSGAAPSSSASATGTGAAQATSSAGATDSTASSTAAGTSAGSGSSATDSLAQDLQSFLHDLFRALRVAHHQESDQRPQDDDAQPAVNSSSTAGSASTSSSASTAVQTAGSGTAPTPSSSSTGTTPASSGTGIANYRQQGLVNALKQLIQDLSNSASLSTGGSSPSSFLAQSLNNLNTSFNKLILDLRNSASSTNGSAATGSSNVGQSTGNSAALQSFLNGFLSDLQSGGASSSGQLLNTSA